MVNQQATISTRDQGHPVNAGLNCHPITTLDSTVRTKLNIPNEVERDNVSSGGNDNTDIVRNITTDDIDRSHNTRFMPYWNHLYHASKEDRMYLEQQLNGTLQVQLRELPNSKPILLLVTENCVCGTCECRHYIGGRVAHLRPCRAFVELFLRGDCDPDWFYLLWGFVFGFRVVDPDCSSGYRPNKYKEKNLIMNKS